MHIQCTTSMHIQNCDKFGANSHTITDPTDGQTASDSHVRNAYQVMETRTPTAPSLFSSSTQPVVQHASSKVEFLNSLDHVDVSPCLGPSAATKAKSFESPPETQLRSNASTTDQAHRSSGSLTLYQPHQPHPMLLLAKPPTSHHRSLGRHPASATRRELIAKSDKLETETSHRRGRDRSTDGVDKYHSRTHEDDKTGQRLGSCSVESRRKHSRLSTVPVIAKPMDAKHDIERRRLDGLVTDSSPPQNNEPTRLVSDDASQHIILTASSTRLKDPQASRTLPSRRRMQHSRSPSPKTGSQKSMRFYHKPLLQKYQRLTATSMHENRSSDEVWSRSMAQSETRDGVTTQWTTQSQRSSQESSPPPVPKSRASDAIIDDDRHRPYRRSTQRSASHTMSQSRTAMRMQDKDGDDGLSVSDELEIRNSTRVRRQPRSSKDKEQQQQDQRHSCYSHPLHQFDVPSVPLAPLIKLPEQPPRKALSTSVGDSQERRRVIDRSVGKELIPSPVVPSPVLPTPVVPTLSDFKSARNSTSTDHNSASHRSLKLKKRLVHELRNYSTSMDKQDLIHYFKQDHQTPVDTDRLSQMQSVCYHGADELAIRDKRDSMSTSAPMYPETTACSQCAKLILESQRLQDQLVTETRRSAIVSAHREKLELQIEDAKELLLALLYDCSDDEMGMLPTWVINGLYQVIEFLNGGKALLSPTPPPPPPASFHHPQQRASSSSIRRLSSHHSHESSQRVPDEGLRLPLVPSISLPPLIGRNAQPTASGEPPSSSMRSTSRSQVIRRYTSTNRKPASSRSTRSVLQNNNHEDSDFSTKPSPFMPSRTSPGSHSPVSATKGAIASPVLIRSQEGGPGIRQVRHYRIPRYREVLPAGDTNGVNGSYPPFGATSKHMADDEDDSEIAWRDSCLKNHSPLSEQPTQGYPKSAISHQEQENSSTTSSSIEPVVETDRVKTEASTVQQRPLIPRLGLDENRVGRGAWLNGEVTRGDTYISSI